MKRYNLEYASNRIIENGYEQEGYEKILPYKLWLSLCKVALTKPTCIQESLDAKNLSSFEELKDFINLCEEKGLTDLDVEHDTDEYTLDYFRINCSRRIHEKKSDVELKNEYFSYANNIIKNNIDLWKRHDDLMEREKKEYAKYLLLKEKYEGRNDK